MYEANNASFLGGLYSVSEGVVKRLVHESVPEKAALKSSESAMPTLFIGSSG